MVMQNACPDGEIESQSSTPMPIKLKRLLLRLGLSQSYLCKKTLLSTGFPPSISTINQIINRNHWPAKTDKAWLCKQIKDALQGHGATDADMRNAFEIEDTPNQLRTAPPSTSRKLVQSTSPMAEDEQLPEPEMLSHKAKKHFRLFQDPFVDDVQGTNDVFLNDSQRYIQEAMFYAARQGRFLAVVGESGSGKSTLRRDLLDKIQREGHPITVVQPRIIDKERLSSGAICDAIIADLGYEKPRRSLEDKARQVERLLTGSSRAGNHHVLIIEEAHDLTIPTLKQLKRFWELEDGYKHLLGIILIGQPELQHKLDERMAWEAREVIRRCEVAVLEPLGNNFKAYLALKFKRIDKPLKTVFAENAYEVIREKLTLRQRGNQQTVSMLYPLNINNTVRRAMNIAAEIGEPKVTAEIVREV